MQHAEAINMVSRTHAYGVAFDEAESVIVTDDKIETAAAKFDELARRLRSGELTAASCYFNDEHEYLVMVEKFIPDGPGEGSVRLTRSRFEPATKLRSVGG